MNYNEVFEGDINKKLFFNQEGYPQKLLINGYISLDNAIKRLNNGEYYVLVGYHTGENLPECYLPVPSEKIDFELPDGLSFASFNPDELVYAFCDNSSIQLISKLPNMLRGAKYMLGPGPDEIYLEDLVSEQLQNYKEKYCSRSR